jgi:hypothetical protein
MSETTARTRWEMRGPSRRYHRASFTAGSALELLGGVLDALAGWEREASLSRYGIQTVALYSEDVWGAYFQANMDREDLDELCGRVWQNAEEARRQREAFGEIPF